jgi:hypothetical protein
MVRVPSSIGALLEKFGKPAVVLYGFDDIESFRTAWVRCEKCKKRYLGVFPQDWDDTNLIKLQCVKCRAYCVSKDLLRL